jgi:2-dehydropantoate 2-reductase
MKIAIVGAGAIGGWIGAKLAVRGHAVSVLARGATLAALQRDGLLLREGGVEHRARVQASEQASELGAQDLVVIAVKAPALGDVARQMAPLLGADSVVMTAMNGVPWWFFDGIGGAHAGLRLKSVDPQGALQAALPSRRIVGCVVHATCSTPAPGVVQHGFGQGLILGEAIGDPTPRTSALAATLADAGFKPTVSPRIQRDIWYKLWGNMTINPVSALTGASTDRILDEPLVEALCLRAMAEAAAIGERIGCPISQSGAERMALTRELGSFKTSMLQDVQAGKPLEIEALLGAVHEIGVHVGVPTPSIDGLYGLARLYGRERGLYR